MNRAIAALLALALVAAAPPQSSSRGNPPPSRPAPPQHFSAPPQQHYQPPPQRVQAPPQHFNVNNDLHAPPPEHVTAPQHFAPQPQRPAMNTAPVRRPITSRPSSGFVSQMPQGRAPQFHFQPGRVYPGPVIRNPHWDNNPWRWNRGIVWYPAPAYWGGGFWGAFAFGVPITVYGYYAYDDADYQSYQVAPDSPGAQLLTNYQLTQTPCGPPNLVVIWGPNNSVICAYPNDLVAAGQYTIDPSTLSLVSSGS